MLGNPKKPHTNDLLADAGRRGVLNELNLQYSRGRSLRVANDFFR